MLKLLFHAGKDKFVIECSDLLEVVPRVNLLPMAHGPKYVAGVLNYHGDFIPIVDLCYLISGDYAKKKMSTRIAIIEDSGGSSQKFGFIAEQVTGVLDKSDKDFAESGFFLEELPFIARVCKDNNGIIYEINVPKLCAYLSNRLKSKSAEAT